MKTRPKRVPRLWCALQGLLPLDGLDPTAKRMAVTLADVQAPAVAKRKFGGDGPANDNPGSVWPLIVDSYCADGRGGDGDRDESHRSEGGDPRVRD